MTQNDHKVIELLYRRLPEELFRESMYMKFGKEQADKIIDQYTRKNNDAASGITDNDEKNNMNYSALTKFIPAAARKEKAEFHGLGAVTYSKIVLDFIEAVNDFAIEHDDMNLWGYKEILADNNIEWNAKALETADVSTLDAKVVLAMITGVVSSEKFDDGTIAYFWNDGCIKKWLERLQEIDKQNS